MTAFSSTPVRLLLAVLVAAGAGGAIYLGVRGGGDDKPQVVGQLTQTLTVVATPTASPSTVVEGTSTAAPTLEATTAPPLPTATPDPRVSIGVPRADQLQLGKDGTYFVADPGDGCTWREYHRDTEPAFGLEVFLRTDCPSAYTIIYQPEAGVVSALVP